jgi:hypothetical protein
MRRHRVLLVGGSLNQTTQMHQIARELPEAWFECWFTVSYVDGALEWARRRGLLEFTIVGDKLAIRSAAYLAAQRLPVDRGGTARAYDLVLLCQDLVVPRNLRRGRSILVQEGMTDEEGWAYRLQRRFPLVPRWIAGTASMGLSDEYDRFCVASEGYRDLFVRKGVRPEKLVVTGIPNFDDCARHLRNSFPHRGYVLVCSSDSRETFKRHDRAAFIREAVRIGAGRPLVFKLHPNEDTVRATREIEALAPGALVYATGKAEEMVANCDVLVVERSSLAYVGLALGKEVHARTDAAELRRLLPAQHGQAARNIARVACELVGVEPPERIEAPAAATRRARGHAREPVEASTEADSRGPAGSMFSQSEAESIDVDDRATEAGAYSGGHTRSPHST